MKIEPFRAADIPDFLQLATAKNWVSEAWEFEFLLTLFPEGCLCLRDTDGKARAFVTSLPHDSSGWIGNLLVEAGFQGKGFGTRLFMSALEALEAAGVRTFWLTASPEGKALYEKNGFNRLDTIVRWSGTGRQQSRPVAQDHFDAKVSASMSLLDSRAWGNRRDALLQATVNHGRLLQEESGFLVIQSLGAVVQLGPFSALSSIVAETLCDKALAAMPQKTKIYIDAPLSNQAALLLFKSRGMRISGSAELMYAGVKPNYCPEILYGLATMGSCG